MMRHVLVPVVAAVLLSACASTESAKRDDTTSSDPGQGEAGGPIQPAERPPEGAPEEREPAPTAAPAPAEPAPQPAPAAAAEPAPAPQKGPPGEADRRRSPDGIDDDTPLPNAGSAARQAFDQATQTARTNPAAAVQQFLDAAGKTNYFYAAYFNAGAAAEAAGDAGAAERNYRAALKERPDYGPALINLYLLLRNLGRAQDADRTIDDALAKHGDRAGPHVAAAMRHYVNRRKAKVKEEALAAIRIDERQVPAMQLMAAVFFEEGRYETARFALENALRLEPGNALLHLELGHVLIKLDEEKRALTEFATASALRPDVAEAHSNYGVLVLRAGDADKAVEAFRKVTALKPNSAVARMHLGNGLRAQKHYEEAAAAYQQALQLDPNLHKVHFNLAIMYLDNEVPGLDFLARLKKSQEEFGIFKKTGEVTEDLASRIDDYEKTLKKRIRREEKRIERAAERKAIEAEKKAKEAAEGAQEGGDGAGGEGTQDEAPPADGDAAPEAGNTASRSDVSRGGGADEEDAK